MNIFQRIAAGLVLVELSTSTLGDASLARAEFDSTWKLESKTAVKLGVLVFQPGEKISPVSSIEGFLDLDKRKVPWPVITDEVRRSIEGMDSPFYNDRARSHRDCQLLLKVHGAELLREFDVLLSDENTSRELREHLRLIRSEASPAIVMRMEQLKEYFEISLPQLLANAPVTQELWRLHSQLTSENSGNEGSLADLAAEWRESARKLARIERTTPENIGYDGPELSGIMSPLQNAQQGLRRAERELKEFVTKRMPENATIFSAKTIRSGNTGNDRILSYQVQVLTKSGYFRISLGIGGECAIQSIWEQHFSADIEEVGVVQNEYGRKVAVICPGDSIHLNENVGVLEDVSNTWFLPGLYFSAEDSEVVRYGVTDYSTNSNTLSRALERYHVLPIEGRR